MREVLTDLDVVPPPGIEPGPLGLQPSAQTNCARVGGGAVPGNKPRARRVFLRWVPARAPSSSSLFGCQRAAFRRARKAHLGRRCSRGLRNCTSRVFAIWIDDPDCESRNQVVYGARRRRRARPGVPWSDQAGPGCGPKRRRAAWFPRAALSRVCSDLLGHFIRVGPPGEAGTAGDIVICPKLRGFRRDQHRRGTGIRPTPRRGGEALPGLTVM